MARRYKIVVLPGDGVGREVVPEAVRVLKATQASMSGLNLEFLEFECGFEFFKKTGKPWLEEAYIACKESDAILYGAIGLPGVEKPGHVVYVDLLLRQELDLFANVRPVKLRGNIPYPLVRQTQGAIDFVIIRENTEDLYASIGGALTRREETEMALDVKIVTRRGAERVIKHGFELSRKRGRGAPSDGKRRVTCVDKSTLLRSCALFRQIFDEVAVGYPDIERDYALIDAWMQWVLRHPETYDVIVTTNLFGDIMTDMTAILQGGLGLAPSAEIGDRYGLFRPIHGSAPKYYGQFVVNPIAAILSSQLLLDWLGNKHDDPSAKAAAARIERAVNQTLQEGKILTRDIGGTAKTYEVGNAIAEKIMNGAV
jgi:3-isopropylmalate dehydrogenase